MKATAHIGVGTVLLSTFSGCFPALARPVFWAKARKESEFGQGLNTLFQGAGRTPGYQGDYLEQR